MKTSVVKLHPQNSILGVILLWALGIALYVLIQRIGEAERLSPAGKAIQERAEAVCSRLRGQYATVSNLWKIPGPANQQGNRLWEVSCAAGDERLNLRISEIGGRVFLLQQQEAATVPRAKRVSSDLSDREARWLAFAYLRELGWAQKRFLLIRTRRKTVGVPTPEREFLFNIGDKTRLINTLRLSLRESDGVLLYSYRGHIEAGQEVAQHKPER